MKEIYLTSHGYPTWVSNEGYDQILAILEEEKVCSVCGRHYTDDAPEALRNVCLTCVPIKEHRLGITFLDFSGGIYRFICEEGGLYTAQPGNNDVSQSVYETLLYYGFHLPTAQKESGKEFTMDSWSWSFYGDPRDNPVIVIRHYEIYGSNAHDFHWLAYRDGGTTFLSKRSKWIRELYRKSLEEGQKTHGSSASYYLYGTMADIASGR